MVQEGKCDVCRRRKVKCDEARPVCGACSVPQKNGKGPRPCSYSLEKLTRFPGNQLASSGDGLFLTFQSKCRDETESDENSVKILTRSIVRPRRSPQPMAVIKEPSSPKSQLLRRFISQNEALAEGSDYKFTLGEWTQHIPHLIGNSKAIDSAVDCFLSSLTAYVNRTPQNMVLTDAANARTICCIRSAIESNDSKLLQNDVLVAISLLFLVEGLVRGSTGHYKFHQTGLLSLVRRVSKEGTRSNDVVRSIFLQLCDWDLMKAILEDRDSVFDNDAWAALEWPGIVSLNPAVSQTAITAFHDHHRMCMIQIPRLARLIKKACISPEDITVRNQAIDLAAKLYHNDLETLVQRFFETGLIKILPTSPEYRDFVKNTFEFTSFIVYVGCMDYWTLRILLGGFVLKLLSLPDMIDSPFPFETSAVEAQDVRTAELLAMCTEHSVKSQRVIPLNAIRQIQPLRQSFGAWHRLEVRAGGEFSTTSEAQYARHMKRSCSKIASEIGFLWGVFAGISEEVLLKQYQLIMGEVDSKRKA